MESIFETILTNAGMAGALLLLCGWALWKKDQQVKALQEAAVAREREQAEAHSIEGDEGFGGERATATFYCTSQTDPGAEKALELLTAE